jgi:hypothetical protein
MAWFIILGGALLIGLLIYKDVKLDRARVRERKEAWTAMHDDPRCAAFIRMLLSSGFVITQITPPVRACRYCDLPHRVFVHGPKKMESPTGEVFLHQNVFHGTACLRCGFLGDGADENDTNCGEIRLFDFVEQESVQITRAAYEAELDRLAISAEEVRQKLRLLPPENAYREPAMLPESKAIRRA